jgi:iron-sulfur cluster assembly protein
MDQKSEHKIERSMTIGDIVSKYPELVETLLSFGVHCVGCHVAHWESLEDGFRSHGMSEEEIDEALKILNEKLSESPDSSKLFNITDKAAEKIKELIVKQSKSFKGLKIGVMPGGCSGFQYELEFAESAEDSVVFEDKGVTLFLSKDNIEFLKGSKLDYIESLQGAGFRVSNPNATTSCGCGQSFSR